MAYFSMNGYDSYSGCDIVVTATLPLKTKDDEEIYFTLGSLQTLSVSSHQDKRPVRSLGNINAKDYVMGQRTIAGSLVFAVFDRHFADKIMKSADILMADEIPALDLTISFANEYGRMSSMRIFGVKLLNEGQVMSINDLYTENTYQFVALGMEPLSSDLLEPGEKEKELSQLPTGGVISPSYEMTVVPDMDEFNKTSGKEISDKIKNNIGYSNKEGLTLTAEIEQPIEGEDTGIVTLRLSPIQHEGFIYITNLISGENVHSIIVNSSEFYNVELPVGYYNARYMNTTRTRESNIEKIVIKIVEDSKEQSVKIVSARSTYPIIENITNRSITVSMYNKDYNTVVCFSSGGQEHIQDNSSNFIIFDNLKSDTEYKIYAKSGTIESNTVTAKTFPDSASYYNKFKEFLTANRGMLQNDYDTLIGLLDSLLVYNTANNEYYWPYDNIIDGVSTLSNSLEKQELLLYAMNFENSMLEAYNINNPYRLKILRNNAFETDFSVDGWNTLKYYSKKNNKNKLESILPVNSQFSGLPINAYSVYGIKDNNCSVKQYITVFSSEGKELLNKYRDINKYKTLDLTQDKAMYPFLDAEDIYAITIRDNMLCDKQMIDEPYVYVENDIIYADVKYDDKIFLDETYYLCVSDIYATLDTAPKRKIPFNRHTKIINLTNEYIPFNKESVYHFWIESHQGNVISKAFIFNYRQSPGLQKVLDKELLTLLNTKKRLLSDKISNRTSVNDIIYDLYCASTPKKDIDTKLEYALLEYGATSRFASTALEEYLYETVVLNVSDKLNINRINQIDIYRNNSQFMVAPGSDLDIKVLTKSYDLSTQEVECNIYNPNTNINLKGDYMTVYLINEHVNKVLGLVVIDCKKFNYKELGFNVKVGDK